MKIAVINEVSASIKNEDIVNALHQTTNAEVLNVGMKNPEQIPLLTYIHTSCIGISAPKEQITAATFKKYTLCMKKYGSQISKELGYGLYRS